MTRELSDYPPPGMEVRLLGRYVSLEGKRILEIGAGAGRLTRQIAPLAKSIMSIEPDAEAVADARRLAAAEGISNVSFHVGFAERIRISPRPVDLVLFSWAL